MDPQRAYQFLDCGAGRRLERLGPWVIDRPAPTADGGRLSPARWAVAIRYRAGRGWAADDGARPHPDAAEIDLEGATLESRLGPGGQVGFYPEHAIHAAWVRRAVLNRAPASPTGQATTGGPRRRGDATGDEAQGGEASETSSDLAHPHEAGQPGTGGPATLNLFAHSGLLTLVAARAGAAVTHVDASRPAVQAARRNADLSGLADHPIRWIVDDALAFVEREGRRGRRYAGFILDPPSYGHGARGEGARGWQFTNGIDGLLAACAAIARPDAFWLVTTHTPGWTPDRLAGTLSDHLPRESSAEPRSEAHGDEVRLGADSGASLALGVAARVDSLRQGRP